jgi:hypothetical protein
MGLVGEPNRSLSVQHGNTLKPISPRCSELSTLTRHPYDSGCTNLPLGSNQSTGVEPHNTSSAQILMASHVLSSIEKEQEMMPVCPLITS